MKIEIPIGTIFGRWRVISEGKKPEGIVSTAKFFFCECQCSGRTQRMVMGKSLRNGTSKSCGCLGPTQNSGKDETGKVYGKWKVISVVPRPSHISGRGKYFLCECSCGTQRIIAGHNLRSGVSDNCGCSWKTSIRNPDGPFNLLFWNYSKSAKERKKSFDLSLEDIKRLTQSDCFYCGQKPTAMLKQFNKRGFVYNGIDRTDNSLGYTKENCVPCCKICNTAKLSMTVDQFRNWITLVYKKFCTNFAK
jgi:hypothetical protein